MIKSEKIKENNEILKKQMRYVMLRIHKKLKYSAEGPAANHVLLRKQNLFPLVIA